MRGADERGWSTYGAAAAAKQRARKRAWAQRKQGDALSGAIAHVQRYDAFIFRLGLKVG